MGKFVNTGKLKILAFAIASIIAVLNLWLIYTITTG
jgi:Mn2+/Fe2+ NRAMP family transporter